MIIQSKKNRLFTMAFILRSIFKFAMVSEKLSTSTAINILTTTSTFTCCCSRIKTLFVHSLLRQRQHVILYKVTRSSADADNALDANEAVPNK